MALDRKVGTMPVSHTNPFPFADVTELLSYENTPTVLYPDTPVPLRQLKAGNSEFIPLYMRAHLMQQKASLDAFIEGNPKKPNLRSLWVTGPPGSGKTSFLTLWARMYARSGKRVLIVSFHKNKALGVVLLNCTEAQFVELEGKVGEVQEEFRILFNQTIEGNFDLVLFDGVREGNPGCDSILRQINSQLGPHKRIAMIIFATSLSFRVKGQDGIRGKDYDQLHFISWVYEEYEAAFKIFLSNGQLGVDLVNDIIEVNKGLVRFAGDGTLIEVDDTMDGATPSEEDVLFYLEQKFFYAGGSARFMYDYTKEKLIEEFNVLFGGVKDWKIFTSNDIPGGEAAAVNSLMQQFTDERGRNPKCLAVSRYVLLHAADKCTESLVEAVSAMAALTGNPSLKGWAFELRQIEIIKSVFKESETGGGAYIGTTEGLSLLPRSEIAYDGSLFFPDVDIGDDASTVMWCLKWNQGCFDVAFYVGTKLVTLQFTIQDNHSLKLQYVTALRNALVAKGKTVSQVVHIAVVEGDVEQFRFKTAEGTGRRINDVDYIVDIFYSTALTRMEAGIERVDERVELTSGYKINVYGKRKQPPGPGLR